MKSLSSIIKSTRILQGNPISIAYETQAQAEQPLYDQENEKNIKKIELEIQQLKAETAIKAEQMIKDAEVQVTNLLKDTETHRRQIIEEETARLHQEREAWNREKQEELKSLEAEREKILQQIYEEKNQILMQIEPEVVEVIKKLVDKIIDKHLVSSTEWLTLLVRKMILKEQIDESITWCLSNDLYEKYGEALEESIQTLPVKVEIKPNAQMNDTSCMIETAQGSIFYDVKEGLEKVLKEVEILASISG